MDSQEIKRLRRNFTRSTMRSFILVTVLMGLFVNVVLLSMTFLRLRTTLNYISELYIDNHVSMRAITDNGLVPDDYYEDVSTPIQRIIDNRGRSFSDKPLAGYKPFTVGIIQGIRYFAVSYDLDKRIINGIDNVNLSELDDIDAATMAHQIMNLKNDYGAYGVYFYKKAMLPDGNGILVCLNYQEGMYSVYRLMMVTIGVIFIALIFIYVMVRNSSLKAIMPEIRNSRHQKEFITNASHELKTPLAVIKADTEYLEMTQGENEWTKSIMNQVDRMNGLIQNLVMISRSSEQSTVNETDTDISALMKETIDPFLALIKREEKEISISIQEDVHLTVDPSKIRMLCTVLVDNAIKYCDEKGKIEIFLIQGRNKKAAEFLVSNTYSAGANVDYKRFFERFYREDKAHHSDGNEKSGYGIGLSVAESICSQHGGRISSDWKDGVISFKCQLRGL